MSSVLSLIANTNPHKLLLVRLINKGQGKSVGKPVPQLVSCII